MRHIDLVLIILVGDGLTGNLERCIAQKLGGNLAK